MSINYRTYFEQQVDVAFDNLSLATQYFCGPEFQKTMFDVKGIGEIAQFISATISEGEGCTAIFVEGIGGFIRQEENCWQLQDEYTHECGGICVHVIDRDAIETSLYERDEDEIAL